VLFVCWPDPTKVLRGCGEYRNYERDGEMRSARHHQKVERIAVMIGHDWQRWVIGTIRLFVHLEVRDDKGEQNEALRWITE